MGGKRKVPRKGETDGKQQARLQADIKQMDKHFLAEDLEGGLPYALDAYKIDPTNKRVHEYVRMYRNLQKIRQSQAPRRDPNVITDKDRGIAGGRAVPSGPKLPPPLPERRLSKRAQKHKQYTDGLMKRVDQLFLKQDLDSAMPLVDEILHYDPQHPRAREMRRMYENLLRIREADRARP